MYFNNRIKTLHKGTNFRKGYLNSSAVCYSVIKSCGHFTSMKISTLFEMKTNETITKWFQNLVKGFECVLIISNEQKDRYCKTLRHSAFYGH